MELAERVVAIIVVLFSIVGMGLMIYYGISGQSPWSSVLLGLFLLIVIVVMTIIAEIARSNPSWLK